MQVIASISLELWCTVEGPLTKLTLVEVVESLVLMSKFERCHCVASLAVTCDDRYMSLPPTMASLLPMHRRVSYYFKGSNLVCSDSKLNILLTFSSWKQP